MANLNTKEILEKISGSVEDKEKQVELYEDIIDTFGSQEKTISEKEYNDLKVENDLLKAKYTDLQNKYISRFTEVESPISQKQTTKMEELEEKKVVNISSIFK